MFYDAPEYADLNDETCSDDEDTHNFSSKVSESVEVALESFRVKWQQELQLSAKNQYSLSSNSNWPKSKHNENNADDAEEKARQWFLKGAELERSGIFYEAIQCYRKAVQLVPDIEFKVGQKQLLPTQEQQQHCALRGETAKEYVEGRPRRHRSNADCIEITLGGLMQHIQQQQAASVSHCRQTHDQKATHISTLPPEIILLIFKWIVSADLDLRSLEMVSMVCRGWYLLARDEDIWKLACVRVWGANCGSIASVLPASSWRSMYLQRPRLHYTGCYISKTSYFRHGENSFQDQFYRPWHLVCYYRYMRFFPDGIVLLLTTTDEPHRCVGLLKKRNAKAALRGHYHLNGDRVSITAYETGTCSSSVRIFRIELQIISRSHRRRHTQLVWTHYSIAGVDDGREEEVATTFDVGSNLFPPLWFSRVRSYTSETSSPLC